MTEPIVVGTTLDSHESFTVDSDSIIMGRSLIASVTRYGKSWTNRRLVEQLVGKAGIVIIDPEGEYASLRTKFPFLIIGKDVPLQVETAEFLAETTLKEDLSVIIDLSLIDVEVGKEYVSRFINHFMFMETTLRKPYWFVVEEADEFCPEKGVAKATSLEALKNLAKKGGKRGIGLMITTHRPAFVSKMVLSQCTTLKLIGRIEWDSDLDVIKEFLQVSPLVLRRPRVDGKPTADGKPHVDSLEPGQFYIGGSAVDHEGFVKIGAVETKHLGATPDLIPPTPKELAEVVKRLSASMPKIIEQKLKPTIDIEVIKKEAETKASAKAEEKLATFKHKVEAENRTTILNLKNEVKGLSERLDAVSRQASFGAAPITDPFEHPIVKNTITKLSTRAQQLLIKIEREPGRTREQLAAFLTSSKDAVANVIAEINRTFKAEVIVNDGGRPIKYRSMLQRLYITDVAKREINRIAELQNSLDKLRESYDDLMERFRALQSDNLALKETLKHRPTYEELAKMQEQGKTLAAELKQSALQLKKQEQAIRLADRIFSSVEQLVKEVGKFRLAADVAPLVAETKSAVLPEKTQPATEEGSELGRTLMAPGEHGTPKVVEVTPDNLFHPEPLLDFALREKMIAFLRKRPKILFTEDELVLALGENKLFHETFISLDDCAVLEVTDQGVRAK